jgi:hypothetical protein
VLILIASIEDWTLSSCGQQMLFAIILPWGFSFAHWLRMHSKITYITKFSGYLWNIRDPQCYTFIFFSCFKATRCLSVIFIQQSLRIFRLPPGLGHACSVCMSSLIFIIIVLLLYGVWVLSTYRDVWKWNVVCVPWQFIRCTDRSEKRLENRTSFKRN